MEDGVTNDQRFGYEALFKELNEQGVSRKVLETRSGLDLNKLDPSFEQRVSLFRAAQRLSKKSETGLLAGMRQEIGYWGHYGYAMATSGTFADVLNIAAKFPQLSGTLFRITLTFEDEEAVFRSYQPESIGEVLPFVAEYWRASQTKLFSLVLGKQFPSTAMKFPYPRPSHAKLYRKVFQCPVEFNSEEMEWRFDASILRAQCIQADENTAELCRNYCELFVGKSSASTFQGRVLRACMTDPSAIATDGESVAALMNLSRRTLYRRLNSEGVSFKTLTDQLRGSVAIEYLKHTTLSVEDIAARCGYQDVSNFRKAFRRWTNKAPSSFRMK